jgi:hypothetical protein
MQATAAIFTARIRRELYMLVGRGLSQEQIEHEILNSRDLSKKGPPLHRLAYATRTPSKAIAPSAQ